MGKCCGSDVDNFIPNCVIALLFLYSDLLRNEVGAEGTVEWGVTIPPLPDVNQDDHQTLVPPKFSTPLTVHNLLPTVAPAQSLTCRLRRSSLSRAEKFSQDTSEQFYFVALKVLSM